MTHLATFFIGLFFGSLIAVLIREGIDTVIDEKDREIEELKLRNDDNYSFGKMVGAILRPPLEFPDDYYEESPDDNV